MPNDRVAEPAPRDVSIKLPDQLQQSSQMADPRQHPSPPARQEALEQPTSGVLQELKTERAHD